MFDKINNSVAPLVSVILPTFNRGKIIKRAINSVINQTYKNWELIIIDDGSTDITSDVVGQFLSDSRIKYLYQENGGPSAARNLGINNARGSFLCFLDSDDEFLENKIELHLLKMRKFNAIISISNVEVAYNNSRRIKKYSFDSFYISYLDLIDSKIGSLMNIFLNRESLENIKFDNELSISEDLDLILKIFKENKKILFINHPLLRVYKTFNSNRLSLDYSNKIKNYLVLINKFKINKYNIPKEYLSLFIKKFYLEIGLFYLLNNDCKNAKEYFKKGIAIKGRYKGENKYKFIYIFVFVPKLFNSAIFIGKFLWSRGIIKF
jgi:glycosyltransferase involved in cell wall biosynthesis